jgi:hypothetical protein
MTGYSAPKGIWLKKGDKPKCLLAEDGPLSNSNIVHSYSGLSFGFYPALLVVFYPSPKIILHMF